MARLNLNLLGYFEVSLDREAIVSFRSKNIKGLLLYLCLHPKETHSRESLATLFWPEKTSEVARRNLRATLKHLRESLNDKDDKKLITADRKTISINKDEVSSDVIDLQKAIKTRNFQIAATLFEGELAPNFSVKSTEFNLWLDSLRQSLHAECLLGLIELTNTLLHEENYRYAQEMAHHQLRIDKYNENGLRQLMIAYALGGDVNKALYRYNHFRMERALEGDNLLEDETMRLADKLENGELDILPPRRQPQPISHDLRQEIINRIDVLPDQKLFGITDIKGRIVNQLDLPSRPWTVSIEGLGGLGKTSMAHHIVKHYLDEARFANIAWISAKQIEYVTGQGIQSTQKAAIDPETLLDSLLAQLSVGPYPTAGFEKKKQAAKGILDSRPHLIVVDNLETVTDYQELLPLIRFLSKPSKFVITSRMSLQNEADVYCENISELSESHTVAFLRHEIKYQNILTLKQTSTRQLVEVYNTVGGNPLALKLVLGQAYYLSLGEILKNMVLPEDESVEQLYIYIYRQAWNVLDQSSRTLFTSLPLAPNGTFDQLRSRSNLPINQLIPAIENLRRLSLLNVSVPADGIPRYKLHRLTETFLLNEVLKWQDQDRKSTPELEIFGNQLSSALFSWLDGKQIESLDPKSFDNEHDALLSIIHLGLDSDQFWPFVKSLILILGSIMERRGQHTRWLSVIEKAIEAGERLDDMDSALELANLRGRVLQRVGNEAELRQNYARVIRLAKKAGNQIEKARACSNLGYNFIDLGNPWRAEILNRHALAIFNTEGHKHGQAHTHNHLGLLNTRKKDFVKAESHLQTAVHIWQENEDDLGLLIGLGSLGHLYNEMEQPLKAISVLEKALQLGAIQGENGYRLAINQMNLGIAHRKQAEFSEALEYSNSAEQFFKSHGIYISLYHVWENLGHIQHGLGNQDGALDYFIAAREGFEKVSPLSNSARLDQVINEVTNNASSHI